MCNGHIELKDHIPERGRNMTEAKRKTTLE